MKNTLVTIAAVAILTNLGILVRPSIVSQFRPPMLEQAPIPKPMPTQIPQKPKAPKAPLRDRLRRNAPPKVTPTQQIARDAVANIRADRERSLIKVSTDYDRFTITPKDRAQMSPTVTVGALPNAWEIPGTQDKANAEYQRRLQEISNARY
jgi:hypothetical protein